MGKNIGWAVLSLSCLLQAMAHGSSLNLSRFLGDVMAHHPEMAAAAQATEQAFADTLHAGLPENPELGAGFFHAAQSQQTVQSLSLTFPWRYGLREARVQAAKATGNAAKAREREARAAFKAEAAQVFLRLQIQNRRFLWQDSVAMAWKALIPIADKAAASGRMSALESGQVRLKASEAMRLSADIADGQKVLAAALEYYAGYPISPDDIDPFGFGATETPVLADSQIPGRLQENPSLRTRDAEILEGEKSSRLAQALARPEIGWTLGYEKDIDGQHLLGGEIHLPLPWFQRNQGDVAKSRFALAQAKLDKQAELGRLQAEARDLVVRLQGNARALMEYEKEIKPILQSQVRLAQEAFQQGRLDIFDLSRIQEEAGRAALAALDRWETHQTLSLRLRVLVGEPL